MGIITEVASEIIKDVAIDVGLAAADKGLEAGGKATGLISQKVGNIKDNRNKTALKKQAKKEDYFLFVSAEKSLGDGIYKVVSKKKEERYNTLMDHLPNDSFILHIYHKQRGEMLSVHKIATMKQGIFSSKPVGWKYELHSGSQVAEVFASTEGRQKIYVNNFNDWVVTGDFGKRNYKIFSKSTGKTIATVTKKIASADTYVIVCEYDRNEPIVVAISMLLDMIE